MYNIISYYVTTHYIITSYIARLYFAHLLSRYRDVQGTRHTAERLAEYLLLKYTQSAY